MSNWTHINCNIVGTFNEQKIEELFGKPVLDWKLPYQYTYGSKKWEKAERLVEESYNQSKLPCGEVPLNYVLRKPPTYKRETNVYGVDEDILTLWGDLRGFEMSNKEHFKQIEEIVNKIINSDSSIRSFILQAHEEYSGKTYIWSSSFDNKPILTILDKQYDEQE